MLLKYLTANSEEIVTDVLIALKDLVRKYRNLSSEILTDIEGALDFVTGDEGKAAVIWMFGEFGEHLENSPYIIESFIQGLNPNESLQVSYALISASVKLFLKRAPEMHNSLETLFKTIFEQSESTDLLDRASFYYKLLENSPSIAEQIINSSKNSIEQFYEDTNENILDLLMQEFNTLSVLYQKPSKAFSRINKELISDATGPDNTIAPTIVAANTELLTLDIVEEIHFSLMPNSNMAGEEFQELWEKLEAEGMITRKLTNFSSSEDFENRLAGEFIQCMASGEQDIGYKFYFYARESTQRKAFLLEVDANLQVGELVVCVKCENPEFSNEFMKILYKAILPFIQ
ncbi:hypothetical protein SteCoe_616 [Stentor coeruleus]|uniref:Beta-adaptin appendage C-terminal subdomain domain-containing protein n=1 Tax=Stentor coeruleus TaxID=5963 RepID=A0A1R2D3U3_9CILI|nr:hypothetical protein SteCoe_616 [Stentor coeruleus]